MSLESKYKYVNTLLNIIGRKFAVVMGVDNPIKLKEESLNNPSLFSKISREHKQVSNYKDILSSNPNIDEERFYDFLSPIEQKVLDDLEEKSRKAALKELRNLTVLRWRV